MHGVGGDIERVAGGNGVLGGALDGGAPHLARRGRFAPNHLAAYQHGACAGTHNDQVGLLLVEFGFARAVAKGDEGGIQQPRGAEVPLGIQFGRGFLVDVLQLGGAPEQRLSGIRRLDSNQAGKSEQEDVSHSRPV